MDITANKLNEWMQVERRRKLRADGRSRFFYSVRRVFIFLFIATIFVFAFNYHTQIQTVASENLGHVIKKSPGLNGLRQKSLDYEKEVNDIAK